MEEKIGKSKYTKNRIFLTPNNYIYTTTHTEAL